MAKKLSSKQRAALLTGQEIFLIARDIQKKGGKSEKLVYKIPMQTAMKQAKTLWQKANNKLG